MKSEVVNIIIILLISLLIIGVFVGVKKLDDIYINQVETNNNVDAIVEVLGEWELYENTEE